MGLKQDPLRLTGREMLEPAKWGLIESEIQRGSGRFTFRPILISMSHASNVEDEIMRQITSLFALLALSFCAACASGEDTAPTTLAIPTTDAGTTDDTSEPDTTVTDVTDGDASTEDVATYEDDCGDGMICILGECKERSAATSCIAFGQCCEEDADDCTFGADGCFCDVDCVASGDCCPDACAACGFCNEDGEAVAPSCEECLANDVGTAPDAFRP